VDPQERLNASLSLLLLMILLCAFFFSQRLQLH
jgi:hypothetical protein